MLVVTASSAFGPATEAIKQAHASRSSLRTYVRHLNRYTVQHVDYREERQMSAQALVRTKVIAEREVLLVFWVVEQSGDWKVYDVVVDGMSLIENYRGQFTRALRLFSYADLLAKMRQNACMPHCNVQSWVSRGAPVESQGP